MLCFLPSALSQAVSSLIPSCGAWRWTYAWTAALGQCHVRFALCAHGIGRAMDLDWLKDFLALASRRRRSRARPRRGARDAAGLQPPHPGPRGLDRDALFLRGAQGAALSRPASRSSRRRRTCCGASSGRGARRRGRRRDTATLSIAATHALSVTFFRAGSARSCSPDARDPEPRLRQHGSLRADHAVGRGALPALPLPRGCATRFESDRFESVRVGHDRLVPLCAPAPDGRGLWALARHARRPSPTSPTPSPRASDASSPAAARAKPTTSRPASPRISPPR